MAGRRSKYKRNSSKYKVQFDNKTARTWIIPLLRRIEAGDYPAKAGRIIGLSRQHVGYYVKKLEKARLIKRQVRSSVVFYELTGEGKSLLGLCEGTVFPAELYRLDKCQVSFEIVVDGRFPDGFKPVEMVNWTALLGLEQGVSVKHTSRSWIVHVEVIRGRNPVEVTNLALNLANRIRDALVKKYGCVLGEGRIVAAEIAVEDPIATLFGRYFTVRTDKRKIDHSWNVGELEHLQKDAVIAYLQMPEKVGLIEKRLEKLTDVLSKLVNLEVEPEPPSGQRSMKDYVS